SKVLASGRHGALCQKPDREGGLRKYSQTFLVTGAFPHGRASDTMAYLSFFTPNPLISVETIDSAKLRAMRITAGSSSLKKLRGSFANSNSPRKIKFWLS